MHPALLTILEIAAPVLSGVTGYLLGAARERSRGQRRAWAQPQAVLQAPAPFGRAHSRASLAVMQAATEYVRDRLGKANFGLGTTECRALKWLLVQLVYLPTAIAGDPWWDSTIVRRRLAELDAVIAPGTWWQASQALDSTACLPSLNLEVPRFVELYDAAFVSALLDVDLERQTDDEPGARGEPATTIDLHAVTRIARSSTVTRKET